MKKFIYIMLSFIMILPASFPLKEAKSEVKLMCDENGDFTILAVSDPQCDNSAQWDEAKAELETLIKRSNPNLILICGDMNTNNKIPKDMWDKFISPAAKRNIYWATINGNHDPFKEKHYKMYTAYDTCLNSKVSILDPNYEAKRPMNYVLPVYSVDGKKPVFAVYLMDTGTLNKKGYEGLTKRQINWYKKQSDNLKKLNGLKPVTSLLCIHIPLPQTIDMYYSMDGGGTATEKVPGGLNKTYGIVNEKNSGIKNYTCENGTKISKTAFWTTAPNNDRGIFKEILKQGDVKAVLFGHAHRTNIIGSYKGVLLGFTGKLSTGCYSDKLCRGGRVIKFNQSNPEKFTVSWFGSLKTSKDQSAIYSDGTIALKRTICENSLDNSKF